MKMNKYRKAVYDWGFEDGSMGRQFMPDDLNSMDEQMLGLFREDYRRGFLAGEAKKQVAVAC
jgi:hypothetical protein